MVAAASPTRRVLGDKPTNASLHQGRHTVTKTSTFEHVRKHVPPYQKERTPKVGEKRSIDHVDGTEEHAQALLKCGASLRLMEPAGGMKTASAVEEGDDMEQRECARESELVKEQDEMKEPGSVTEIAAKDDEPDTTEPSPATQSEIMTTAPVASFHPSQEGSLPIEEQFDIQYEASQNTLENLVSKKHAGSSRTCALKKDA